MRRILTTICTGLTLLSALAPCAHALPTRGLWVQFERRGWPVEYWAGQVIQQFTLFDDVVGSKVSDEVALQLDVMRGLGVNTITIELRTADATGDFQFPACNIHPFLGFQWPQPTATELANLTPFLDLVHSKGIRVILVLVNTHMEEQPPANSQAWLGAILGVVKNHPALDFVVFNGTPRVIDTNGDGTPESCGVPAEAPLWLGPTAVPATYVKWAIGYAMSLGLPASKLSVGTIVGDFFTDSQPPAGPDATDGHLWSPIVVLKRIFDSLGIPDSQRVYALSFYEHRKCATARSLPCVDADPPTWADQTMQGVFSTIGQGNGARVVAYEMGNSTPVDPAWSTASALANLVTVMRKYGTDGGSFWRWTNFSNSEDADVTLAEPIKRRGVAFTFNPVQTTLVQAYTSLGLSVATNSATFVPGGSLVASVTVDDPGLSTTVDFYFGALLPDGDTVVFFTNLAFARGVGSLAKPATLRPIVAGVDLTAPFTFIQPAFFTYTWTGGEAPGTYVLFVAAVRSGALADNSIDPGDIVALSTATVTFTR